MPSAVGRVMGLVRMRGFGEGERVEVEGEGGPRALLILVLSLPGVAGVTTNTCSPASAYSTLSSSSSSSVPSRNASMERTPRAEKVMLLVLLPMIGIGVLFCDNVLFIFGLGALIRGTPSVGDRAYISGV